jgi:flavin-binding protein dodecin
MNAGAEQKRRIAMRQVARVTELSAESDKSFDDAVQLGVARANKTLRNVRGAWIKEQQVDIENGIVIGYRVNMLVTFVLDEEP